MSALLDVAVVTGLHRSGTTFLANVLASARRTRLLGREPLNPRWGVRGVQRWYQQVDAPDGQAAGAALRRLRRGRPVPWAHPEQGARGLLGSARQQATVALARARSDVLVVKDPFLSLSLPFVHAELTDRPIVLAVRHPAAWTMSLERVGWHPGSLLDDLVTRPGFDRLAERVDLPHREWQRVRLAEASAWCWVLLTEAVYAQQQSLPAGAVVPVPLESMRTDPVGVAMGLVEQVGLAVDDHARARVQALTHGADVVPTTSVQHVLVRDTRSSVESWRTRMDPCDRRLIWSVCEKTAFPLGYQA